MFASVLKLFPLFKRLRQDIYKGELPLEDAVRQVACAADLVVAKLDFLLPALAKEESVTTDPGDEPIGEEYPGSDPVMEEPEVVIASANLRMLFEQSSCAFPPGQPGEAVRDIELVTLDASGLRQAYLETCLRTNPARRTLVIPKRNFALYLKEFWRRIAQSAGQGAVLRFSRFLGRTKSEAILSFLSFLELVKRRRVFARQEALFEDIYFSTKRDPVEAGEGARRKESIS